MSEQLKPCEREAFESWYFDNWPHGETTPIHHAHKKGCWEAWQYRAANTRPTPDVAGDVVKRVARSIMKEQQGNYNDDWQRWIPEAKAAIAAKPQGKALSDADKAMIKELTANAADIFECPYCEFVGTVGAHTHPCSGDDMPQPQPVTREELVEVLIKGNRPDNWWRTLMQPVADAILSQFNVTRK